MGINKVITGIYVSQIGYSYETCAGITFLMGICSMIVAVSFFLYLIIL